jgi:hypothetical protein
LSVPAEVVLPPDSALFHDLHEAARSRRCIFFAGLPGVGKSLLLQQQVLLAHAAGRVVHLLQWDVARGAFETPALLARYPEVDGVTHAAIRRGVGLWVREAVRQWHEGHRGAEHLLIGETPLVGNRLVELAQVHADALEPLLADRERTLFFIPVPTSDVRQAIERSREHELASPRHERETANASLGVLASLWRELERAAASVGAPSGGPGEYDPDLYLEVYRRLLRHRQSRALPIERVLPVSTSPHELDLIESELRADEDDVARIATAIASYPSAELERDVAGWYRS